MPSSRRLVLSFSLAGLAALGAYAWYANRPPAVLPGGMQPAGAQGGPAAAGTAGAKAVPGGAGAAQGAPVVVETHTVGTRALADDVTDLVHSPQERQAATAAAAALFGRGELRELDAGVLAAVAGELGNRRLARGAEPLAVVDVLVAAGVVASKSAARRAIVEGGAYLNNSKVSDPDAVVTDADLLAGRYVIARRGKRTVGAVELAP